MCHLPLEIHAKVKEIEKLFNLDFLLNALKILNELCLIFEDNERILLFLFFTEKFTIGIWKEKIKLNNNRNMFCHLVPHKATN